MSSNLAFRHDINGLRAWAVVAVVLYHFGVPGFDGGFVGVDVFFVISGYLMTRIITTGLEHGRYTYLGFCTARAVRIVPALLGLCAVLLALGYLVLTPLDYRTLATHAFSSATFISNFKYWDEAGYFDAASHEKWLLHTWSLSVEWQFYLLIPLVLAATWAWRPNRKALLAVCAALMAASLLFNLWATGTHASMAFYLLPSRAWELLLGGIVALALEPPSESAQRPPLARQGLVCLGLAFIAAAVALFDAQSAWPGWRALLPALGAAMVLAANLQTSWLTHNAVLRWLGERSYSIYLWHWPVYVTARYLGYGEQAFVTVVMLAATACLGEASYRLLETPSRLRLNTMRQAFALATVGSVAMGVLVTAFAIRSLDGIAGRVPAAAERAAQAAEDANPRTKTCNTLKGVESASCLWGGNAALPPSIAVVGDSHADSIVSAVGAALPPEAGPAVQWSYSGCSFMLGSAPNQKRQQELGADYACGPFQEWARSKIDALPPNVPLLIVNRYAAQLYGDRGDRARFTGNTMQFNGLTPTNEREARAAVHAAIIHTACTFAKHRRVLLLRPIPEMGFDVPRTLARRIMMGQSPDVSIPRAAYEDRNAWVWQAQDEAAQKCGAEVLDPTPLLCDGNRCFGNRGGVVLYYDDDHLSETGNKLLTPLFSQALGRTQQIATSPMEQAGHSP